MIENFQYLIPEIFLAVSAMAMLMFGVFSNSDNKQKLLFTLSSVCVFITLYLLFHYDFFANGERQSLLGNSFVYDRFAYILKFLCSVAVLFILFISANTNNFAGVGLKIFEFPVLILLSLTGMFLLISANDLLVFYIGLELTSLATYVLVAINRDSEKATEAGVKYFILGALASGIILFGSSLVYGFLQTTNLSEISVLVANKESITEIPQAAILGIVLILSGIFFKISAVPMHMWAPDVYEGSTKTIMAFVASAPKVASVAFLIRFLSSFEGALFTSLSLIIVFVSAASMLLGAFAALRQKSVKRLLAYSSIANMGYVLVAVSVGTEAAIDAAILYLIIYIFTVGGIFLIFSVLNKNDEEVENISELSGLHKVNPFYAFSLTVLLFSVAGIPPMTGFFAKLFVFLSAIESEMYILASIGVVSSVVACFYYLKLIKTMYFDDLESKISKLPTLKRNPFFRLVVSLTVIFSLFGVLFINELKAISAIAASSL